MQKNFLLVLLVAGLLCFDAFGEGRLTFRRTSVDGDRVTVYIEMETGSGDSVSALNFQLKYDSRVLRPVSASASGVAADSGKSAQANMATPGTYNILLMGVNTNSIASGDVLEVVFETKGDGLSGKSSLRISDLVMATPEGKSIPSSGDTYTFLPSGEESGAKSDEDDEGDQESVEPVTGIIPPIPIERPVIDANTIAGGRGGVTGNRSAPLAGDAEALSSEVSSAEDAARASLVSMSEAGKRADRLVKQVSEGADAESEGSEKMKSAESLTSGPEDGIVPISGEDILNQAELLLNHEQSQKLDNNVSNPDNKGKVRQMMLAAFVVAIAVALIFVKRWIVR